MYLLKYSQKRTIEWASNSRSSPKTDNPINTIFGSTNHVANQWLVHHTLTKFAHIKFLLVCDYDYPLAMIP